MLEIKEKYHQKRDSGYYEYKGFGHTDEWQYINKGFVAIDWSDENMDFEIVEPYQRDESLIIEKEVEYLKRLTALCLPEDVDIIWVTAPIPVYSMMWMGNYEEAHDYFKALAKNCDVEYYDFNYCRREIFDMYIIP